jgi:Ca2+-binding EF-hand superfamily protein
VSSSVERSNILNALKYLREIFNLVDKDRSGAISRVELAELIDTLGIDASPEVG